MAKQKTSDFNYSRRVHFYETDMLGIVHHSNFLRYFEEARMAWLKFRGLDQTHAPHGTVVMAVLETRVFHHRPVFLDDELTVRLQLKLEKLKIRFSYVAFSKRHQDPVATGETLHVPLDKDLKVCRLPRELLAELESESWIETWPSNLFASRKPRL